MKKIFAPVAALALSAAVMTSPTSEAKADGGAVAIGVGAYLLVDAIVGKKCERHSWPFNIITKVGDELHGRPGCRPYYGRHHHRRHHW